MLQKKEDPVCRSVECSLSVCEAFGSIPSDEKNAQQKKKSFYLCRSRIDKVLYTAHIFNIFSIFQYL